MISLATLQARVGSEIGISPWIDISQQSIDDFAAVTIDHQFIHVDPVRAQSDAPFGGTIAHGFLTLSLLSHMIESALPEIEGVTRSINYGFDRIRFLSPVPSGSQIRGRFELLRAEVQRDAEVTLCCRATIEIRNHERPALVADWLVRYYLVRVLDRLY